MSETGENRVNLKPTRISNPNLNKKTASVETLTALFKNSSEY